MVVDSFRLFLFLLVGEFWIKIKEIVKLLEFFYLIIYG